jgi:Probable Zinc-ribbon domain/PilZ domain
VPKSSESYNLYIERPDLAKEWHPTKNGGLGPRDVTPGSGRKVWWLCENGHWWLASVRDRVRGRQCTFCQGLKNKGEQRMADVRPELLKEWHPSRNTDLKAKDVYTHHHDRVWWICAQGHEWEATIRHRLTGRACPFCDSPSPPISSLKDSELTRAPKPAADRGQIQVNTRLTALKEAAAQPVGGPELRRGSRYQRSAVVMIEKWRSGILGYAELQNFSASGMMLRSDFSVRPGELIRVRLDQPLPSSDSNLVTGRVIWCRNLEVQEEESSPFGIGLCLV